MRFSGWTGRGEYLIYKATALPCAFFDCDTEHATLPRRTSTANEEAVRMLLKAGGITSAHVGWSQIQISPWVARWHDNFARFISRISLCQNIAPIDALPLCMIDAVSWGVGGNRRISIFVHHRLNVCDFRSSKSVAIPLTSQRKRRTTLVSKHLQTQGQRPAVRGKQALYAATASDPRQMHRVPLPMACRTVTTALKARQVHRQC